MAYVLRIHTLKYMICNRGEKNLRVTPIHKVLVRTYFCTASIFPESVQARARAKSRCFALFMSAFLNAESTSQQRHTIFCLAGRCEPEVDEMSLGNSIRTAHTMSVLISVS